MKRLSSMEEHGIYIILRSLENYNCSDRKIRISNSRSSRIILNK